MQITKISIKNLFGIREINLNGDNVELTGKKGSGKTSVIDAIRYALTNSSDRDYIVRNGETEGEILIETDTGLSISRKKRTNQSDYKSIKEFSKEIEKPQAYLNAIFTPLQLDPVAFTKLSRQEQNRMILDLIEFDWDLNWIRDKFGEIPEGVDYEQNILQVLNDIQSENGVYFQRRQDVNRDIRNKQAMISDVAKDIPEKYDAEHWEAFDLNEAYKKLDNIKNENNVIQRAKAFKENYDNKLRGLQAEKEMSISAAEREIASEREELRANIERLKAEIVASEDKLNGLNDKLKDKKAIAEAQYNEKLSKLDSDIQVAEKYLDAEIIPVDDLQAEIDNAVNMKKHLNEYRRMRAYQSDVEKLKGISGEYTRKIELARELPAEILKESSLPIEGMTIKDGIPLINGLPVSNLSDGEKLDLCVDITIAKENNLKMILLNGTECMDDASRTALYEKCKAKGIQIIAARTTNDDELEVTVL